MLDSIISNAADKSKSSIKPKQGDYYGDGSRFFYRDGEKLCDDKGQPFTDKGLLYCGKCGQLKQIRLYAPFLSKILEPYVPCKCEEKKDIREYNRIAEENRQRQIDHNLAHADKLMLKNTFKVDQFPDSAASRAFRDYCRHWRDKYYPKGFGLYIFGGVGVGKTFYASCIANEIAKVYGDTVKALSITKAINDMYSTDDKTGYIDQLASVDLLILDDFGAERKTEYSSEVVFSIIDERYKSQKPLIITSNTNYSIIKNQRNNNRVFDRIVDMCVPYQMDGNSKRGIQF